MQLHEFITETLVQVAKGVENANKQLSSTTAIVNPRDVIYNSNQNVRAYGWLTEQKQKLRALQLVEFDVLVTATEGKQTKAGVGVAIATLGIGGSKQDEHQRVAENRIKFGIPIVLPNEKG